MKKNIHNQQYWVADTLAQYSNVRIASPIKSVPLNAQKFAKID